MPARASGRRLANVVKFQAPRGTRDLLPAQMLAFQRLRGIAEGLAARYGYQPIETPLFEDAAVFERAIGAATDVVEKELFRVASGGGGGEAGGGGGGGGRGEAGGDGGGGGRGQAGGEPRWALRPEATAGVVRAYVEHGMHTLPQPVRFSTFGPMFRYDRPQAGRYRQFWQWNVEAIGDPGPAIDAELIELGLAFLREAGVADAEVQLNSIGDQACRPAYVELLTDYLRGVEDSLPSLERQRLRTNPLRVLDSKDASMAPIIADAPKMADHLCTDCAAHYAGLRAHLLALDVPFHEAPHIVRGLDYYARTAFEYFVPGREGQQQALGGGGRYDGLAELLGGRPTPGVGLAIGVDRVAALVEDGPSTRELRPVAVVVGADPAATDVRLRLATDLRRAGITASADLATRKLARQLDAAARAGAHFAVVVGDELTAGQVQLRDLEAGTQRLVNVADLAREIARAQSSHRHGEGARGE
jgi:histidyl-tRNA synthetase